MFSPIMRVTQKARSSQFEVLGARTGAVVFLGDSITEQGLWSDWFPDVAVSNRGIGGETTRQIAARLDSAIDRPRGVFLLAGTNDLAAGDDVTAIAARLIGIADAIRRRSPDTPIIVQGVMPRAATYAAEISELNIRLRKAVEPRPGVRYLDLWAALAQSDHALRKTFTEDSLHLNGAGYSAWVEVLRPIVDELHSSPVAPH